MNRTVLLAACLIGLSIQPVYASGDDNDGDNTRLGYLLLSGQGDAKFSDDQRSFVSNSGAGLSVMLHKRGDGWLTDSYDVGLDYSHFQGRMNSVTAARSNFSLNNFIANVRVGLGWKFYFEGGYGLSVLSADEKIVGGCWKWGFGANLHLVKSLYASVEINRWDGPGPVGFWSPSLGLEYHF